MKISFINVGLFVVLSFILNNIYAESILDSWSTLTSNTNIAGHSTAILVDSTIYVVADYSGLSTSYPVESATISTTNDLSGWSIISSSGLITARQKGISFYANGYIYYFGGANFYDIPTTGERAKINPDSTISAWTTFGSSPFLIYSCAAIINNNNLYIIGGYPGTSTVHRCSLNSDGTLGSWILCTSQLNIGRYAHSALVVDGYLFVACGANGITGLTTSVERAQIFPNGELGAFSFVNGTGCLHGGAPFVKVGNFLYIIDGYQGGDISHRVERTSLNPDMSLGTWEPAPYLNQQRTAPYAQTSTAVYMISGGTFGGTPLTSCERSLILNDTSVESNKWQFFK